MGFGRGLLLSSMALVAACATALPPYAAHEEDCLVYRREGGERTLYRGGRAVHDNDLVVATADDATALDLAESARSHHSFGIGGLVVGGAALAPALGTFGYGVDHHQAATTTAGGVVMVVGSAALMAGAALELRARDDRAHAIEVYNGHHAQSCHP